MQKGNEGMKDTVATVGGFFLTWAFGAAFVGVCIAVVKLVLWAVSK